MTNIIAGVLRNLADDVENGVYKCGEDAIEYSISTLSKLNTERPMSKELACKYLNLSRSVFDTYIRSGKIPKGLKLLGFKELSWNKAELDKVIISSRKNID